MQNFPTPPLTTPPRPPSAPTRKKIGWGSFMEHREPLVGGGCKGLSVGQGEGG